MFCKYCGAELAEDAKFCMQCGAGLDESEPATEPIAAKPKANKKIIAVAAAALAVVAALIVFLCVKNNGVNASPEAVAEAYLVSLYEFDAETQVKCWPDFMIKEVAVEYGLKNASRRAVTKELAGMMQGEIPEKVIIKSVRVVKEYDVGEIEDWYHFDFGNNLRFAYGPEYAIDRDLKNIRTAAKVKVRYTVDGEEDMMEIVTVKIKSKWYILPVGHAKEAPAE